VSVATLGGKFDIIFCLAIEAHLKNKQRLYRLLNKVSSDMVFFEGNSTTDPMEVQNALLNNGFRTVEFIGFCDDDCLPSNNNRPLLIARK
jgi:hypothetical protein